MGLGLSISLLNSPQVFPFQHRVQLLEGYLKAEKALYKNPSEWAMTNQPSGLLSLCVDIGFTQQRREDGGKQRGRLPNESWLTAGENHHL